MKESDRILERQHRVGVLSGPNRVTDRPVHVAAKGGGVEVACQVRQNLGGIASVQRLDRFPYRAVQAPPLAVAKLVVQRHADQGVGELVAVGGGLFEDAGIQRFIDGL